MLLRNNLGLSLALAGRHEEFIELLRAVVDGSRAPRRATARTWRSPMAWPAIWRRPSGSAGSTSTRRRCRATWPISPRSRRSTIIASGPPALGVSPPELNDRPSDPETGRRVGAIALEGNGLELGLAPTGRWFVNLGDYGSAQQAVSAWRRLRSQHNDLLGDLSRLAGVQDGQQPLLVGPLSDAERAQALCSTLRVRGQNCRALAL